ncbi:MAG: PD-(D/E)XK nuclease family protein [Methylacidiphilales bacterium]|nr:PD-(D/E)XK nuclease family protein [Candidatus Methylacidiphilales bacterium]
MSYKKINAPVQSHFIELVADEILKATSTVDTVVNFNSILILSEHGNLNHALAKEIHRKSAVKIINGYNPISLDTWISLQLSEIENIIPNHISKLLLANLLTNYKSVLANNDPLTVADSLLYFFNQITISNYSEHTLFQQFIDKEIANGSAQETKLIFILWDMWNIYLKANNIITLERALQSHKDHLINKFDNYKTIFIIGYPLLHAYHANLIEIVSKKSVITHFDIDWNNESNLNNYGWFTTCLDPSISLQKKIKLNEDTYSQATNHCYFNFFDEKETMIQSCINSIIELINNSDNPIAILCDDRKLFRRLRARLFESEITVIDPSGWPISTLPTGTLCHDTLVEMLMQHNPKESYSFSNLITKLITQLQLNISIIKDESINVLLINLLQLNPHLNQFQITGSIEQFTLWIHSILEQTLYKFASTRYVNVLASKYSSIAYLENHHILLLGIRNIYSPKISFTNIFLNEATRNQLHIATDAILYNQQINYLKRILSVSQTVNFYNVQQGENDEHALFDQGRILLDCLDKNNINNFIRDGNQINSIQTNNTKQIALPAHAPLPNILTVSDLTMLLTCSAQFYFNKTLDCERVIDTEEVQNKITFGLSFHDALRIFHQTRDLVSILHTVHTQNDRRNYIFKLLLKSWRCSNNNLQSTYSNYLWKEFAANYACEISELGDQLQSISSEQTISLRFGNITIKGVIDVLFTLKDNCLWLGEFKSGITPSEHELLHLKKPQLLIYGYLLEQKPSKYVMFGINKTLSIDAVKTVDSMKELHSNLTAVRENTAYRVVRVSNQKICNNCSVRTTCKPTI